MEPPDPGLLEVFRKDGSLPGKLAFARALGNHRVGNGLAERAHRKLQALQSGQAARGGLPTPPGAWKDMPTKGDVKVFTLLIDFNDCPHNGARNALAQMRARIFGTGDGQVAAPYESYAQFYERSSYHQLHLQPGTGGGLHDWYRVQRWNGNRSEMPQTTAARELVIKDALEYYRRQGENFAEYDNNGDGRVDFFCVVWTGPDNGWANFWWGYQTSFSDTAYTLDGVGFGKYSWQWESRYTDSDGTAHCDGPFSPGTMIHEQGHGLGLPDYYDYDAAVGPRGGVGGLDIMDGAGDHNCFSKWLLDWIEPEVIDPVGLGATASRTLGDQSTGQDALVVMPGASFPDKTRPFGEFFMIQNRQPTGNDANRPIPGSGLLVWHVDSRLDADGTDFRFDNSYTEHKLLRLMEADGLEDIETRNAKADAGDFYVSGRSLGDTTTPGNARYDGTWTNFTLADISASGPSMTLDIVPGTPDGVAPTGRPTRPGGRATGDAIRFDWTLGTAADDRAIVGCQLQVGTVPGGSDVFDDRVGNVTTKTLARLGLWDGVPLYARVRALDTAGTGTAWSDAGDPVTIDLPVFQHCDVLDDCGLTFKTLGGWDTDSSERVVGGSSASATCDDSQQTYLQARIQGPALLSFHWKASTEKDFDWYSILVDGSTLDRISGDAAWTRKQLRLAGGRHVVAWRWAKDGGTRGTLDRVWLDGIRRNDLNGDDAPADVLDLATLAWSHGSTPSGARWIAEADLDGDGDVDDDDIAAFRTTAGF
jgi:M6 family metalloprotease-like protein